MERISSKPFHLTQLRAGEKFRFERGKFFFQVLEQNGNHVVIKNRLSDKTWKIPTDKVVLKSTL